MWGRMSGGVWVLFLKYLASKLFFSSEQKERMIWLTLTCDPCPDMGGGRAELVQ